MLKILWQIKNPILRSGCGRGGYNAASPSGTSNIQHYLHFVKFLVVAKEETSDFSPLPLPQAAI